MKDWNKTIEVNLTATLLCMKHTLAQMIAQEGPAAIVNTGSKQGITTPPGNAAYNVTKAAVKVLTEALAHLTQFFVMIEKAVGVKPS